MRVSAHFRVLELAVLATCWSLHGAQLPLRRYSTADGLANNAVYSIASDSRGFLWFGTAEGLSRFDGYGFANQTVSTGLPLGSVGRVLIGRHGNYWLATPAGLVRFRPDLLRSSGDRIIVIRAEGKPEDHINTLLEDRRGTLWCGTETGLYAVDDRSSRTPRLSEVRIGLPGAAWGDSDVRGLAEDAEGALWIGVLDGTLYRRLPDRRVERYPSTEGLPRDEITHLLADRKGRIWLGRENGLYRSAPAPHPGANGFERLSGREGLPGVRVYDIFESREGDVWVGMYQYLAQFPADGASARVWTKDNGLPSRGALALGQDRDGNLWLGTDDLGVFKLAAGGILTYSTEDGIGMDAVISIVETLRGELYIGGRKELRRSFRIGFRSGDGFHAIAPRVPKKINYLGWWAGRVILQDHAGEWWLASYQGLCRYPRLESPSQLAQTGPKAVYTTRDGLPSDQVVLLYEDRGGNIWVSAGTGKFAYYWSRSEQKIIGIAADGVLGSPSAFGEDNAGHVWIGEWGRLWRVNDGRASRVASPATRAWITGFLLDHAGRLWVATRGQGLLCFDQPAEPDPQFRQYGYSDGLSSLDLHSLSEDRNGSIYIGSGGVVDRLDPDLAHIQHYSSADGIAPGQVIAAFCDRAGAIWFGTQHGLTRLVPQSGPTRAPPPVWITDVSIAGRAAPVSEAGESNIREVAVQPGQEHLQFDFVGLSYSPGNVLRYQYRLGNDAWSAPIDSRSVHYGALAPGRYQFAVRAINSDGDASPAPATVEFRVVPPVWQRAWFQGVLMVVAMAGAVWVHRARVARLVEIERVRSNIALDLHDDIASNLSQITIFSEIAMREAGPDSRAAAPLARIAETARDTVESIGDIVWSIRPQKEGDLSQRIRRFGSDALTSRQIGVAFRISEEIQHLRLEPNARRQVYLIYKEAVHNTVRHAKATAVEISMSVVKGELVLKIGDNGKGMASLEEGNGLPGMRGRALSLGGRLEIHSSVGEGTEVELRAPLKRKWRSRILPR